MAPGWARRGLDPGLSDYEIRYAFSSGPFATPSQLLCFDSKLLRDVGHNIFDGTRILFYYDYEGSVEKFLVLGKLIYCTP